MVFYVYYLLMIFKSKLNHNSGQSRHTAWAALWLSALLCLSAPALVLAAPGGHASAQTTSSEKPNTGLALLKAKKLAAAPDLDSFAALRLFFNAVQNDDDNILKRAGRKAFPV